jgi:energy-coupling factor transporter ATP-binding protein EcfA2
MTLTARQRTAWSDMQAHVRGLDVLALSEFRRTPEARRWVAVAPLGQVAHADEASIAAYLGARLGCSIGAHDVRVRHGAHPGVLVIEQRVVDPLGKPITGGLDALERRSSVHQGTVIGRCEDGSDAVLRWTGGHTLLVGSTGSGKSTLLRYVAAALGGVDDADVWVAETGKRGEDYDGLALDRLVTTPDDLAAMMADLGAIADQRAGQPIAQRRPIVVIVDEFAIARDDLAHARNVSRSEADKTWQRAFSLWRSAGISLVIGAQRGTNEFVPGAPRSQAMQRVCMRIGSPSEWGFMAADPGLPARHRWSPADFPEHAGMLALQPMGSSQWLRARMWHLPDGAATIYPARVGAEGRRPVADPVASQVTADPTPAVDDTDRRAATRALVLAALTDHPQGKRQIADACGRGATTVLPVLRALADDGLAVQTPSGWRRTQPGEQQP